MPSLPSFGAMSIHVYHTPLVYSRRVSATYARYMTEIPRYPMNYSCIPGIRPNGTPDSFVFSSQHVSSPVTHQQDTRGYPVLRTGIPLACQTRLATEDVSCMFTNRQILTFPERYDRTSYCFPHFPDFYTCFFPPQNPAPSLTPSLSRSERPDIRGWVLNIPVVVV